MPSWSAEFANVLEDSLAGTDVEADGGLVQQQQLRAMDQGASDLHPAHLASGELSDPVVAALGKLETVELSLGALFRFGR